MKKELFRRELPRSGGFTNRWQRCRNRLVARWFFVKGELWIACVPW
jgi:hypothetical protein